MLRSDTTSESAHQPVHTHDITVWDANPNVRGDGGGTSSVARAIRKQSAAIDFLMTLRNCRGLVAGILCSLIILKMACRITCFVEAEGMLPASPDITAAGLCGSRVLLCLALYVYVSVTTKQTLSMATNTCILCFFVSCRRSSGRPHKNTWVIVQDGPLSRAAGTA